ncbi:MAG: gamma-glutamyltransferase [Planctomycetota bacterium]
MLLPALRRYNGGMHCASLTATIAAFGTACAATPQVDLSPARWPAGELERFAERDATFGGQNQLATSKRGVVTGTTGATAVRAGLEALRQGGSAADAALTTSLTQIALAAGSWVSYAGVLTMVYYDAESGEVVSLNAAYDTFAAEDDPLSIPRQTAAGGEPTPSGRTALVPGYMAGVGAAHARFGKLPFEQLFVPALYFAEEGFRLSELHGALLAHRKDVLDRLPETRAVFTKGDGSFFAAGDLFRQPALAETLRAVAANGAREMYTGPWAERFVEAVRREGGKVTADDLATYEPLWCEPVRFPYRGFEVAGPGLPAQGGAQVAEAMQLAAAADLAAMGHYSESPAAFFWLAQITDLMALSYLDDPIARMMVGSKDISLAARSTAAHAAALWERMEAGECRLTRVPETSDPKHSDAIVAIDRWGNVAAVCHTINTTSWGETGLFVGGVSIPDSASFQQALIGRTEPGERLPDPTEPLIVLRDGKPYAALSSIGAGLHQKTVATLLNLLDRGDGIKEAVDAASQHLPSWGAGGRTTVQVFAGDFDAGLLEAVRGLGHDVEVIRNDLSSRAPRGYVVGARIDPETGEYQAVATDTLNGRALGL